MSERGLGDNREQRLCSQCKRNVLNVTARRAHCTHIRLHYLLFILFALYDLIRRNDKINSKINSISRGVRPVFFFFLSLLFLLICRKHSVGRTARKQNIILRCLGWLVSVCIAIEVSFVILFIGTRVESLWVAKGLQYSKHGMRKSTTDFVRKTIKSMFAVTTYTIQHFRAKRVIRKKRTPQMCVYMRGCVGEPTQQFEVNVKLIDFHFSARSHTHAYTNSPQQHRRCGHHGQTNETCMNRMVLDRDEYM